jgi:hypothetical protein
MFCVICGNNTTPRKPNAKNAGAADIGICQACRKRLCRSTFLNSRSMRLMRARCARDVPRRSKRRARGL